MLGVRKFCTRHVNKAQSIGSAIWLKIRSVEIHYENKEEITKIKIGSISLSKYFDCAFPNLNQAA